MRLRIVLAVLSLLSFLSVSVAGYIYYASLKRSVYREVDKDTALQAERIRNGLSSFLSENLRTVKALAGLREMREALEGGRPDAVGRANALLDHFRDALRADVCYLMDGSGTTIASSNRAAPDSFVGKNFSFRPYFREAIGGTPGTYLAQGVASNVRGAYYSHPVPSAGRGVPDGVAVIKAPLDRIEEEFRRTFDGIVLLADPNGVVFVSNRKEWIYRSLRKLSPAETEGIVRSQQFGPGPWEWTGFRSGGGNTVEDASGNRYLVYTETVGGYPGWSVVYLQNLADVSKRISDPFLSAAGPSIVALCVLIGLSVSVLYRQASGEIRGVQDQMRRLSDRIIEGQEQERAAVSRELHDELGQTLTALRLDASWLKERIGAADGDAAGRAREMCGLIDAAIDDVRGIAGRLRPGTLDRLGLVDALDGCACDFERRTRVACVFRHGEVPKVDDKVATAAYRIVQESLTNVARHARASRVDVDLRVEEGVLRLEIADDGRGFDPRDRFGPEGLGLAGMRERAALIGGTLEILSGPGAGTRVSLGVPLGGRTGEADR